MEENIEQARKNQAIFKDLEQSARKGRMFVDAELKEYKKYNNSNNARDEVGVYVGISYNEGKWSAGFVSPQDRTEELTQRLGRYNDEVIMYGKMAQMSGKGLVVGPEDFERYRANQDKPTGLFASFRQPDLQKSLQNYEAFISAGGNTLELERAAKNGGTEKEYLKEVKEGKGTSYVNGLVKESRKAQQEADKEEKKGIKVSENSEKLQEALAGLSNSGTKLSEDKSSLSIPESRPMVASSQTQSQANQIG